MIMCIRINGAPAFVPEVKELTVHCFHAASLAEGRLLDYFVVQPNKPRQQDGARRCGERCSDELIDSMI